MAITLKEPSSKRDHILGPLNAPITIVEYGDLECPNCARAHGVIEKLITEFGRQICYIWRHFPDADAHPNSVMAALALEAAGKQGKFWEMQRTLLKNAEELSTSRIIELAGNLKIDTAQFLTDLESNECMEVVEHDIQSGHESGIDHTPTFYLNGIVVDPATTYPLLRREIIGLLTDEDELSA